MAYKSKAMQKWAGENQPSSVENNGYKSSAMRNYEANMDKKAQQEEEQRQQALLAQQEAEAPRRATLRDLTLGSIGKGYATSRYGNERYDEIMLGTQRQAKQAQKAKEKLEQEKYNFEAKSKAGQAISGAGELVGQIAYNLTNRDTLGAVGANVAGASAVGAVVPLPEELVTIPVAVGRGLKMGSAATSFQVSAAQAYDEMLEAGVSPKTAKTVANVIGGGVAALDAMQVDELAKGFKLAKNAKTEAGEKAAANIAKALAKVGKSTAIETGQEVAQEAVTMVGQDVAKKQEGIKTFTGEEYKQRLGDTAVQSALSFGLLGGAGAVGGAVMNRNNVKSQANEANTKESDADSATKVRKRDVADTTDGNIGTDTNVATINVNKTENGFTSAEIANKTAKNGVYNAENEVLPAQKDSRTAVKNSNAEADIKRKRYGEEGKKLFKTVKDDQQKLAEFDTYYREGVMGKAMPAVEGVLNETEAISAYNAGKIDGETNRTAYAQKQYVVSQNAGLNVESAKNLSMSDRIVYNAMGKAFGKEVVVVPELINTDGTRSNAKIDLVNGRIYIAEDAQNGGRVALAHEVIHDMRVAAPTEFDNLAKLVNDYHKRFNSYNKKLNETAKLYELDKGKIDYYDMMEEMVADFIADNKGAERIVDMLSTDKPLAQKFIDSVKKVVVKLGKLALDKETRKIVNEWEDLVKQLEKAVKATEQKVKETKYPADAKIGDDSFVVSEVRESRKSATYDIAQDEMRQDLVKYGIFTEADSYQFVNSISKLIDEVITPNAAILDMNEDFDRDDRKNISYKPNSDSLYKVSLDFSTLCKKRLMSQYVTEQLQLRLGRAITNKEQLAIRDRLLELKKENDSIEVACALCYVEAARLKSPVQINRFLKDRTGYMTKYFAKANKEFDAKVKQLQIDMKVERGYDADATISKLPQKDKNAINDATRKMRMAYKPSAEEMAVIEIANSLDDRAFLTLGNLEKLAEEQPDIYKAFAGHVASSTRSKELQGNTAYYYGDSRREGVSDALIALMNAENGLRHQSWSDFQSIHLLDTIVAIAELSTRKAKMQAYTKVPSFVKLVGRTGMMINLSLIPNGRTGFINGKLDFSNIEGMDFETAKKLRDTYANTTGTIAIGINDQQIKALLASGEIDYVIPYHASGLNKELRRIVKLESWDDYQNKQSEKKIEGYANLTNNPDWHKKPDFSEWFKADEIDTTKDGVTIMREAAERYKQLCLERGLKPKFDDFKNEPNYWKLLIDRKMVDHKTGKIIMQEAVRPVFDFDVITEMLNEEVQSYDANLNARLMDTLVGFYGDGGKNSEISQRIKQLDKEGKAREAAKKKGVYEPYEQFPMIDAAVAGDERYSKKDAENKKITVGMTDSERYDVLKDKTIKVVEISNENADQQPLETTYKKEAKPLLKALAEKFKIIKSYYNEDIQMVFKYSFGSLNESVNKQKKTYADMGRMFSSFDDVIENAVAIEVHTDKYKDTDRADKDLKYVYVLVGAFSKNNNIVPVKIEVKEFKTKENKLYLAVTMSEIKKADISAQTATENSRLYNAPSASTIKIADLLRLVNVEDEDLRKYIPKQFIDDVIRESRKSKPEIPEGYKERGFAESSRLKTDYDEVIKQEFIDNPEIYKQLANKITKQKAEAIMAKGLAFAETEFPKLLEKMDATAVALGDLMAREYSKMGEHDKAVTVIRDMARHLTKAGQFSQAAVIALTKKKPMTALAYAQRDIDKLNVDGKKRFGSKWKDFELTDAEIEMFKNIKEGDEDGIKKAYETINKRIAKEYPSTIWQKFIEASRISMLLNPRTNAKNIASNMLLRPVTRVSGMLSAEIQKAYRYYNKDFSPTQAVAVKKETKALAKEIWDGVKDTFETTNKYNEGIKVNKREIQVFKEGIGTKVMENIAPGTLHKLNKLMGKEDAGLMETARNATYWFLEWGDNKYVEKNFLDRLGSYLEAKGITEITEANQETIDAAVQVAYKEAMRATFKDDTALSNWLASIKHTKSPYINAFMEMVMPFTKTPANIAMRGIDYSPVGLINTFTKVKQGADVSEVIDELSKNLLGSALIAFGALLFSKGVVTGGEPENEKQAAFLKQQGWLPYAIKFGDQYVTYDWAQPAAIPIIMGVTIMESFEEGRLGVVDAVKNAGVASFNQWIELSPLQSLQEIMGGYGTVGENLLNTAIEMPQRLIPSALGATARTADTTQRLTYSKGNVMQTQKDIAKSKVPGLSKTLPVAYDTWGNAKQRDNSTLGAVINQYINPASAKLRNESAVDLEIDRLYEALGDEAVYPRKADYTIKKDGKTYKLSNKEYSEFQRIMGEASYDNVKALMDNDIYYNLTDLEKSKIIQKIYENAFETAKFTIMEKQGYEKTAEDIKGMQETKVKQAYLEYSPANIAEYYIVHQIIYGADSDKTANGTTIAGSAKKNALNRLVELGFTRSEARRLYDRLKG